MLKLCPRCHGVGHVVKAPTITKLFSASFVFRINKLERLLLAGIFSLFLHFEVKEKPALVILNSITNISIGLESLPRTNALAYFVGTSMTNKKVFIISTPGVISTTLHLLRILPMGPISQSVFPWQPFPALCNIIL